MPLLELVNYEKANGFDGAPVRISSGAALCAAGGFLFPIPELILYKLA